MDATFHFDCPQCKQPIEGPSELMWKLVDCPACSYKFVAAPKAKTEMEDLVAKKLNDMDERLKMPMPDERLIPAMNRWDVGKALIAIGIIGTLLGLVLGFSAMLYCGGLIGMGVVLGFWHELIRIRTAVEKMASSKGR